MPRSCTLKRSAAALCAAGAVLLVPTLAAASGSPTSVTGTVTALGGSTFTILTAGKQVGVIAALTTAANRVTAADYPYVWGGGHGVAGVASVGVKGGPGANGKRVGFDCSGSVAAVLAGAGLWPAGGSVPSDAGVISELRSEGIIARGAGQGATEVTLYDDPGVHIFMNIDGRFFGTSDGYGGNASQKKDGAGWLNDSAPDAHSRAYKQYHVVPSVLKARTSDGYNYTFQEGALSSALAGLAVGQKLKVSYISKGGSLTATAVAAPGTETASGTVTAVSLSDGTVTVGTSSGINLSFSVGTATSLLSGLLVGDTVQVTYSKHGTTLTLQALTVTTQPSGASATQSSSYGTGSGSGASGPDSGGSGVAGGSGDGSTSGGGGY